MCGSSSAPAPAAQPTSVSQVTIPEYAQPYMERLLGKAEALTKSAYKPYGGQRYAGPTSGQQAARAEAAGLETPEGFQIGSDMAERAGLGALGAGQNYFNMATDPSQMQAFMSPYMQNVLDVQKAEALRDAQKGQLAQNLNAARQGTYGGARQLLATTERERNLGQNMANIQAAGMQKAFEAAQQAQQFGSELGLRGYQTGIQGASTLGQLSTAQQQADIDRLKAQETFGGLTQADQQKLMDIKYQDYINQQQYPYKQLGFMSDILRGSANLAGTGGKAMYEAAPSTLSQVGGLGLGALGLYNLLGKA